MPPIADMGLPDFAAFQNGKDAGITYLDTYFLCATEVQNEFATLP